MKESDKVIRNIIGGIWKTATIKEEPEIVLVGGKIYEVSSPYYDGRTRHFSGYSRYGHEGRASTPIVSYDPVNKIGKTQSGRTYKLSDEPATFSELGDAKYVWNFMVNRDKMVDIENVTEKVKESK